MIYHGMIYHIYRGLLDIPRRLGYFAKKWGIPRLFKIDFRTAFFGKSRVKWPILSFSEKIQQTQPVTGEMGQIYFLFGL